MDKQKIDTVLKIILSAVLFLVPVVPAIVVWSKPIPSGNTFLIGLFTTAVFLNITEVVFLVRAVIFPKNKKKWWIDE